jgi:hypothetical protein
MMWLPLYEVLSLVYLGCPGVMPRHVIDLFACWSSFGRPRSVGSVENDTFLPLLVFMEGNE